MITLKNLNNDKQFTLDLLPTVPIEQINSPSGYRTYKTPDGKFPSVTTFLGEVTDKTSLSLWRERVGEEEADRITEEAANRGQAIHDAAELYLKGKPVNVPAFINGKWSRFKRLLNKLDNIKLIEGQLWSKTLGLAGTVDCVAEIDGTLFIVDFKTSRKQKMKDWIETYWLQTTIYSLMFEERYGILIDNLAIFIIDDESMTARPYYGNRNKYMKTLAKLLKDYHDRHLNCQTE